MKLFIFIVFLCCVSCGSHHEDDPPPPPSTPHPTKTPSGTSSNDAAPKGGKKSAACPKGTGLTYENFGKGFVYTYCLKCHNKTQQPSPTLTLEQPEEILNQRVKIQEVLSQPKKHIVPLHQIETGEINLFLEWLDCGAPTEKPFTEVKG